MDENIVPKAEELQARMNPMLQQGGPPPGGLPNGIPGQQQPPQKRPREQDHAGNVAGGEQVRGAAA
jgi:hypothetical protein